MHEDIIKICSHTFGELRPSVVLYFSPSCKAALGSSPCPTRGRRCQPDLSIMRAGHSQTFHSSSFVFRTF